MSNITVNDIDGWLAVFYQINVSSLTTYERMVLEEKIKLLKQAT